MKQKFQLASKIVGLVLFSWGLVYSLSAIPMFLGTDRALDQYTESMKRMDLQFPGISPEETRQIKQQTSRVLNQASEATKQSLIPIMISLACVGLIPAGLGLYLMKHDNLLVRYAFPHSEAIPPPISSADRKSSQPRREEHPDQKYAPPGYFDSP
jgi:hypothetical protein